MNEWWAFFQQDYILRALLAGVGISLLSGPLGVFVIWQRMAFFGDTLAHSGLLGVTLAFAFHIHLMLGVAVIGVLLAILLLLIRAHVYFSYDAILGILSPTILALGLITLSQLDTIQVDVMGFLIGDILAVDWFDIVFVYLGAILGLVVLKSIWNSLLRTTIDHELARVEGVPTQRIQLIFIILLALFVALAVKVVGVLLITALLVIPPAIARFIAKSPEHMAFSAFLFGILGSLLGVLCAISADWPVGPAIVVNLATLFLIFLVGQRIVRRRLG